MAVYRCLICGYQAEIDQVKKTMSIMLPPASPGQQYIFPRPGHSCELAKPVTEIDLNKLEKVG